MGCFDEVCAITRTAIHRGDPIVIVYWAPHKRHKSLLMQEAKDIFPSKSTYEALQVLRKEPSFESQRIERWDAEDAWALGGKEFRVLRGEYNDYGWIETESIHSERPDIPAETRIWPWFLVHEWATRFALEQLGFDLDVVYAEDPILVAKYIVHFAFIARIQLFYPDHLLGAQYFDGDEVRMQIALLDQTREFLVHREEAMEDDDEDDDEDDAEVFQTPTAAGAA